MDSDSDHESLEGRVEEEDEAVAEGRRDAAGWGKTKFNYYFTDYVDKDYPNELTRKEERLASSEQDEALRLQKKLYSTIDNANLDLIINLEEGGDAQADQDNLIELIERQNRRLEASKGMKDGENVAKKRKRVTFASDAMGSDECEFNSEDDEDENDDNDEDDGDEDEDDDDDDDEDEDDDGGAREIDQDGRRRRPINVAIKKNRGLTPYKKKEFRNPRVKHKLKYKKAMTKRRRLVKEARNEFHRYSGESTGIKTSTIRSVKLC